MKKLLKILIFVHFSSPSLIFANSIQDYFNNNPSWSEDTKEIIYLTTRCSGVLQVVGQHRIEVGDQEFGPTILEAGRSLGLNSAQLALDEGVSVENIKERMIYWMKKYADDSISNTDNNNNIFVGDFADDFTTCKLLVDSIN
tara:strand:- start:930 stop:1355 length:426 start_codon:yes stop_codon:yes gene_type:complete